MAKTPPSAALAMNIGASKPPDVPGAERNHQRQGLENRDQQKQLPGEAVIEDAGNRVIADAEDSGHEEADDSEPQRANGRMPKFVDRQTIELILHPVEHFSETDRRKPQKTPSNT